MAAAAAALLLAAAPDGALPAAARSAAAPFAPALSAAAAGAGQLLPSLPGPRALLAAAAYVLAGLPDLLELCYALLAALPRWGAGPPPRLPAPGLGQGPAAALRRVDTHSLMSASAAAAALLGSPLEGGLLLVLFGASHALESRLAGRARGDLRGLLASSPPSAVLI